MAQQGNHTARKHAFSARDLADLWDRLKTTRPKVHCITNSVVQNLTANMLLAAGCEPSMTTAADEITDFCASASALLVNLGTLDEERRHAIATAIPIMREQKKPWVLDPVMIDRAANRRAFAFELMAHEPAIIRGNEPECRALPASKAILAISGVEDVVTLQQGRIVLSHGHRYGSMMTGGGCALSALMAALAATTGDAALAAATGFAAYGIAQDIAARDAEGPGSFAVRLLDELANLTPERLAYDLVMRFEDR
jgi:hydroxyethylthiazole kinase